MKTLFRPSLVIVLALLSSSLHAAEPSAGTKLTCPPDHRERGKQPPAGHEWQCLDKSGLADGPWLTWYDNGQLMSERQMKNGKEHGRQRSWWPNGQLMMEGISYEGNRYKGFKYWSISGEPTELDIKTETVTKKVDEPGKPTAADKPSATTGKPTANTGKPAAPAQSKTSTQ